MIYSTVAVCALALLSGASGFAPAHNMRARRYVHGDRLFCGGLRARQKPEDARRARARTDPFPRARPPPTTLSRRSLRSVRMATTEKVEVTGDAPMRPRSVIPWDDSRQHLSEVFGIEDMAKYDSLSKEDQLKVYEMAQKARIFENSCNQAYMQGLIRGFMHLDNGQESISCIVNDAIKTGDKKYSFYREHCHAIASGVSMEAVMGELMMKETGTCKGAGGSMHIYDQATNFQGGWALVAEQLPYAAGAARSILLDRHLHPEDFAGDDRISVVFVGEGGAHNGRFAETLNAAAKEKLPLLFLVIDNGRAINTFTDDVSANMDIFEAGKHYGIPGIKVDGQDLLATVQAGRAVVDYVRTEGPAILQVHTYRFQGHSPADPEHERGRKQEKKWARAEADPIKIFEEQFLASGGAQEELDAVKDAVTKEVKAATEAAKAAPFPPASLAQELEFPDSPDTDYNLRAAPEGAREVLERTVDAEALASCEAYVAKLREQSANGGGITIGDAVNLAILEEMLRDPKTVIHAEDLQAGSSYAIPHLTQQTFGTLRAADEIIDEGHFIGKALGEGMNGYRPIVELMNANFGIYGMAEISSAGNTFATTGGQFDMPMTIIGAGGTAPNQSLGAEHSQPFHAYVMGIPGLKICTAASPELAYGLTKAMIRDNGPGMLFLPVKMMKEVKGAVDLDRCLPLNKATVLNAASDASVQAKKAVTVLTYLHGVREAQYAIAELEKEGIELELIELTSLKPLDMDTIGASLKKTHRVIILDESTQSGGVGATISSAISEKLYDELDGPVVRLSLLDAPVPYASTMEEVIVPRAQDVVEAARKVVNGQI